MPRTSATLVIYGKMLWPRPVGERAGAESKFLLHTQIWDHVRDNARFIWSPPESSMCETYLSIHQSSTESFSESTADQYHNCSEWRVGFNLPVRIRRTALMCPLEIIAVHSDQMRATTLTLISFNANSKFPMFVGSFSVRRPSDQRWWCNAGGFAKCLMNSVDKPKSWY